MRISKWLVLNFDTSCSSVHYQEPYELSQDLVAKQLELLEKKYGGATKANEATLTRAFLRSFHTYLVKFYFGDLKMCTLLRD